MHGHTAVRQAYGRTDSTMCKRAFILILILVIGGAVFVRLHSIANRHRARVVGRQPQPASRDVGAAMRQITNGNPASAKLWVIDDLAFRNARPDRQWIIGRSDRPATSDMEAAESARADAARQLYPIVVSRLHAWRSDQAWLRDRVNEAVRAGRFDSDAFVERFDRPYGSVYAGSVLLDASADRIAPFARDAARELAARHRHVGIRMALAGALLIATWLACALLNSLTRGYFTTRLGVIAAAITVGILLLA